MTKTAAEAQRKIDAIDKRIDAVRRELLRLEVVDQMDPVSWQSAWDKHPALRAMERSLFIRRADAGDVYSDLAYREERVAERRADREFIANHRQSNDRARLIAAAPELLDALSFIVSQEPLTFAECTVAEAIMDRARIAIAKVEGRSAPTEAA